MYWCFAKVNNRLAEIYFDQKRGEPKILSHCYVGLEEFKTKKEQIWIKAETTKFQFIYRDGNYKKKS